MTLQTRASAPLTHDTPGRAHAESTVPWTKCAPPSRFEIVYSLLKPSGQEASAKLICELKLTYLNHAQSSILGDALL